MKWSSKSHGEGRTARSVRCSAFRPRPYGSTSRTSTTSSASTPARARWLRFAGLPVAADESAALQRCLRFPEHDLLRALPEELLPQVAEVLVAAHDRGEVVPGELSRLRR